MFAKYLMEKQNKRCLLNRIIILAVFTLLLFSVVLTRFIKEDKRGLTGIVYSLRMEQFLVTDSVISNPEIKLPQPVFSTWLDSGLF